VDLPLFFVTGDEFYWNKISKVDFHRIFGVTADPASFKGADFWAELKKHYNVFHIKKPYGTEDD